MKTAIDTYKPLDETEMNRFLNTDRAQRLGTNDWIIDWEIDTCWSDPIQTGVILIYFSNGDYKEYYPT